MKSKAPKPSTLNSKSNVPKNDPKLMKKEFPGEKIAKVNTPSTKQKIPNHPLPKNAKMGA